MGVTRMGKTTIFLADDDEGVVAGYGNRIWTKYTAKWGVQIAGMLFQHALWKTLQKY